MKKPNPKEEYDGGSSSDHRFQSEEEIRDSDHERIDADASNKLPRRKKSSIVAKKDIFTPICVVIGLPFPVIIVLAGFTTVRGRFSGYGLIGSAMVPPAIGLLIGGLLDRIRDAFHNRSNHPRTKD